MDYSYLVLAHPKDEREADWEIWHRGHVREVLQIPGFVSCRRFRVTDPQPSGRQPDWRFMVLYELSTDDIAGCLKEMRRRIDDGRIAMTDASNPNRTVTLVWEQLSAHGPPSS